MHDFQNFNCKHLKCCTLIMSKLHFLIALISPWSFSLSRFTLRCRPRAPQFLFSQFYFRSILIEFNLHPFLCIFIYYLYIVLNNIKKKRLNFCKESKVSVKSNRENRSWAERQGTIEIMGRIQSIFNLIGMISKFNKAFYAYKKVYKILFQNFCQNNESFFQICI